VEPLNGVLKCILNSPTTRCNDGSQVLLERSAVLTTYEVAWRRTAEGNPIAPAAYPTPLNLIPPTKFLEPAPLPIPPSKRHVLHTSTDRPLRVIVLVTTSVLFFQPPESAQFGVSARCSAPLCGDQSPAKSASAKINYTPTVFWDLINEPALDVCTDTPANSPRIRSEAPIGPSLRSAGDKRLSQHIICEALAGGRSQQHSRYRRCRSSTPHADA